MLVLARKTNERIVIDGRIIVKIVRVDGDTVKVGIEAPPEVPVHRQEVYDAIGLNNQLAIAGSRRALPKLRCPAAHRALSNSIVAVRQPNHQPPLNP